MKRQEDEIAIIGVGLRVFDIDNLEGLWEVFNNKINCITDFPLNRQEDIENYAKAFYHTESKLKYFPGTFIKNIDMFDYEFFQVSPKEAMLMDPVQRMLLEVAYNTFQDAGYTPDMIKGSKTGIFVGYTSGATTDNYMTPISLTNAENIPYAMTGNMSPLLPARISHYLDLQGPAMILDTACSSALVSVHEACEAIKGGTCDMALAGGIKLHLLPVIDETTAIGIEEYNGRTRSFDKNATGSSMGEGIISVLLKSKQEAERDGDAIYAVIKGTAINQDGTSSGLTAPNPMAQARVLKQAWENAKINPAELAYIEAHGTATILGDPIEIQGISRALESYTDKKQFCAVSSSKSNLGHLYECAGLASLLRAVCSLNHKIIPPGLHFLEPNPGINFVNSPIYINTQSQDWEKEEGIPRLCGVSAFGISGTNAHVVLQEYESNTEVKTSQEIQKDEYLLYTLSAKSEESLSSMLEDHMKFIIDSFDSLDFKGYCYNTNCYRQSYDHRLVLIVKSLSELLEKLKMIKSSGFQTIKETGIFYGVLPKISGTPKQIRELRAELKTCTKQLEDCLNQDTFTYQDFTGIGENYVLGGSMNWELLYGSYTYAKMHLPVYKFKRNSMWLKTLRDKNLTVNPVSAMPEPVLSNEKYMYTKKIWIPKERTKDTQTVEKVILLDLGVAQIDTVKQALEEQQIQVSKYDIPNSQAITLYQQEILKEVLEGASILLCPKALLKDGAQTYEQLVDEIEHSLKSLFLLSKMFCRENDQKIRIFTLTDNSMLLNDEKKVIKPEFTSLYGYGKGIHKELPHISYTYLDIEKEDDVKNMALEIKNPSKCELVIFRNGLRYVEGITEVSLKEYQASDISHVVKTGGVYLVTGGLGGIAFEVSKQLCTLSKTCTLVLLGRTKIDYENRMNPDMEERIQRLNELKELGAEVSYYAVDIQNQNEVKEILVQVRQQYGAITGVVHSAGIGGGTDIVDIEWNRVHEFISSKIYGTWVLDHETRQDNPDFFVSFSSIATMFSSAGLSGYAAGNTYLDYYGKYRESLGLGITKTINWATWAETGMSVKHHFTIDTMYKTLTNKEGVQGFFDVLASKEHQVTVGEMNFESGFALLLHTYAIEYSPYILGKLQEKKEKQKVVPTTNAKQGGKNWDDMLQAITSACRDVLGYDEIDLNDSFFELGADSILLGHIFNKIDKCYPGLLTITDLFEYPTVAMLVQFMTDRSGVAASRDQESRERLNKAQNTGGDVAIIGVGITLPSANTLEEYYDILSNSVNVVRAIPKARSYGLKKQVELLGMKTDHLQFFPMGYLDEIDKFDYELFGISPRDAKLIDPAARLTLQTCYKAIEDAGYGGDKLRGTNTGVFIGCTNNLSTMYSHSIFAVDVDLYRQSQPVNQTSMYASRIAYINDLKGPTIVLDTACSSSLVSINMAYEQIASGKSEMALAGGVCVMLTPVYDSDNCMGFESNDSKTRAFSKDSNGAAVGEGVGIVMLKSLDKAIEDNDSIYAVIKGGAMNQDGASFGIAAPNYLAQSEVVRKAWASADINPETISYIESHGTGTQLGDSIEIKGLSHAFAEMTDKKQFCGIGSVKTNIGHLNEASGISGLFKLILMLRHKELFPTLHLTEPNPNIDFMDSALYTVLQRTDWDTPDNVPRRAGISGFGMSGTNCHLVIEEAPVIEAEVMAKRSEYPIVISCQYKEGLTSIAGKLLQRIQMEDDCDLADISYTLTTGRTHYAYRIAFAAKDKEDLAYKLYKIKTLGDSLNDETIFTGYFKVVPKEKKNREPGEITHSRMQELEEASRTCLDQITAQSSLVYAFQLYIQGATVNWEKLYDVQTVKHVHLPTYPYQRKRVWVEIPENDFDNMYYTTMWKKEGLEKVNDVKTGETYLIFVPNEKQKNKYEDAFKREQINPLFMIGGDTFEKINENTYTYQPNKDGFGFVFQSILKLEIAKIIYICDYKDSSTNLESVPKQLAQSFYAMIEMVKSAAFAHFKQNVELISITENTYAVDGSEEVLIPCNATIVGAVKSIPHEFENISARAIDVDQKTSSSEVIQEIVYADKSVFTVCYRNDIRYAECIDKVDMDENPSVIRKNGNYLVTGGTGGIGIETARYISKQKCNSITLVSRSGLVPRDAWDNEDLDAEVKYKINAIREMEEMGCTVRVYAADVCDLDAMQKVKIEINREFGAIHGIFHTAGVAGAGFIMRKEQEEYEKVMAPKVYGTMILDEITRNEAPDFMVLYSSAVVQSGEAGQSDYVAANSFLDSFCEYRNLNGRKTYAINWVSWKECGMSVKYEINVDGITRALPTTLALEGLDHVIRGNTQRVMVGQYTINENLLAVIKYGRIRSSKFMESFREKLTYMFELNEGTSSLQLDGREVAQIENGQLRLLPYSQKANGLKAITNAPTLVVEDNSLDEILENVANVYMSVLGYDEIDPFNNFFEMGGDSILLTTMQRYLDTVYANILTVADLFSYTNVNALSEYIFEMIHSEEGGNV